MRQLPPHRPASPDAYPRPKADTGAKAVHAGFGPHAVAVTDTILAYTDTVLGGRREYLTDWQVQVNHAIKETGLSSNTDAVLAVPTNTSEVRLFELDNGTTSQARLAKEVWDYERYAGHRVWEGARGTIGGTYQLRPHTLHRRQPIKDGNRLRPARRYKPSTLLRPFGPRPAPRSGRFGGSSLRSTERSQAAVDTSHCRRAERGIRL
ncbi:replication-relaxation family protein [Streptomyces sp. NPDC031705]|uniref:replication-relaxation family protein n=1 Tax=Streptomyces sp. NPDC031705 TaxID=3155729 RepID=UPI0033C271DA